VTLGRSGASHAGAISRRAPNKAVSVSERFGFQNGAKHLGLSETVALRGAAAEGDLGRVLAERGSLQPPRSDDAATRVLEGTYRGGILARQTVSPSLVRPRPVLVFEARVSGARAARFHRGTDLRKQKKLGE